MSTNEQDALIDTENQTDEAVLSAEHTDEVGGGAESSGTYTFFHDLAYGATTIYNGAVSATTDAMCYVTGNC